MYDLIKKGSEIPEQTIVDFFIEIFKKTIESKYTNEL
jgi:hypothetical protein